MRPSDDVRLHRSFELDDTRKVTAGGSKPPHIPDGTRLPRGMGAVSHFESTPQGLANIRESILEMQRKRTSRVAA